MNDIKFKMLEAAKGNLTIEDAIQLYEQGVVTICEDGKAARFDFTETTHVFPRCAGRTCYLKDRTESQTLYI